MTVRLAHLIAWEAAASSSVSAVAAAARVVSYISASVACNAGPPSSVFAVTVTYTTPKQHFVTNVCA